MNSNIKLRSVRHRDLTYNGHVDSVRLIANTARGKRDISCKVRVWMLNTYNMSRPVSRSRVALETKSKYNTDYKKSTLMSRVVY